MLISSFSLFIFNGGNEQDDGGVEFLTGIGLLCRITGTLNGAALVMSFGASHSTVNYDFEIGSP
jgi:hypothetical protein